MDSFSHGYLLAELHSPFLEKNSKHHDAVKNTNATFGWGTKSGKQMVRNSSDVSFFGNLLLYHTEDKNLADRKRLYLHEGTQYYHGNLFIPEDLESLEL